VNDDRGVLTEAELVQIMTAALKGTGRPCTTAELFRAVQWANGARVQAGLLGLVLAGGIEIRVDREPIEFRSVA
jgi:hypothetical protein